MWANRCSRRSGKGDRGKVEPQAGARRLRAQSLTLDDSATRLGVSKSSVSLWVRDAMFWLRHFFVIDEARLRLRVYLHQGLDLDATETFWAALTSIPRSQFHAPWRAIADPSIRRNKHEHGCVRVVYSCTTTHRQIMGLVRALLSSDAIPG